MVCGTIAMITMAMIMRKIYLRKKRERSKRKPSESQSSSHRQSINDDEDVVVVFKVQKRSLLIKLFSHLVLVLNCIALILFSFVLNS